MLRVKQLIKMALQNVFLPILYRVYARRPLESGSVLFADAHHEQVPFAMQLVYDRVMQLAQQGGTHKTHGQEGSLSGRDLHVLTFIRDFRTLSFGEMFRFLTSFMKAYATAETVFICDYFLPVASCRKRKETTVVQLWHSCGLLKKIAYDSGEDVPKHYRGDMYGNYTWLTLSAQACVEVHERALKLPRERIRAVGISRTDHYFDPEWNAECRRRFYKEVPQAAGKKIALWAPTFRGNAGDPRLEGLEAVRQAAEQLKDDWYFVLKAHPHVDAHGQVSNCRIPTEELLCVADVLVTDYSSVLFDYLIYEKPAVLFAPDLDAYERERGFYIDYRSLPYAVVTDGACLAEQVQKAGALAEQNRQEILRWKKTYTGACDGHATERILRLAGILRDGPG